MIVRLIAEDGEIFEWHNVETIEEGFDKIYLFPPRERDQLLVLYHSESLISELENANYMAEIISIDINDTPTERIELLFEKFERRWQLDKNNPGDRV